MFFSSQVSEQPNLNLESAGLSNYRGDLAQAKVFILKKFHKVSPFPK